MTGIRSRASGVSAQDPIDLVVLVATVQKSQDFPHPIQISARYPDPLPQWSKPPALYLQRSGSAVSGCHGALLRGTAQLLFCRQML